MIDLHVHSAYSKHAAGTIDDVIRAAIGRGVRVLTITDHAPFPIDAGNRLLREELERYAREIDLARTTFADSIEVLRGFEVDYLPEYEGWIREMLSTIQADFLLGSVHYMKGAEGQTRVWDIERLHHEGVVDDYFASLEAAIRSGMFDAIAHPDQILRGAVTRAEFVDRVEPLLNTMASEGLAYELNSSGLRKPSHDLVRGRVLERRFPETGVYGLLRDLRIPVTLGSDAHCPTDIGRDIEILEREALTYSLNIVYYQGHVAVGAQTHLG